MTDKAPTRLSLQLLTHTRAHKRTHIHTHTHTHTHVNCISAGVASGVHPHHVRRIHDVLARERTGCRPDLWNDAGRLSDDLCGIRVSHDVPQEVRVATFMHVMLYPHCMLKVCMVVTHMIGRLQLLPLSLLSSSSSPMSSLLLSLLMSLLIVYLMLRQYLFQHDLSTDRGAIIICVNRYGYGAVGFTFCISAIVIEWGMLNVGFWACVQVYATNGCVLSAGLLFTCLTACRVALFIHGYARA